MSVLVVGGAGYIGSHVCKALAQAGFIPVTYDSLVSGHAWAVKWGPFVQAELSDKKALKRVFQEYRPCAVIHLAGHINVRESLEAPWKYYQNNVAATLSLLETMEEEGVFFLIFSSSAAVYGTPRSLPIDEDHPKTPLHPYGKSKDIVEQILEGHPKLRFIALRYFNAAGADSEGEIGEAHSPETHLIPLAIQAALKQKGALKIFGKDHPTQDGTTVRDYIHVTDLAEAHLRALLFLLEKNTSTFLNIGTGNGFSVKEILEAIEKHTGLIVPFEIGETSCDAPILVANPLKAKKLLQWETEHSSIENIVQTAYSWHKNKKFQ